MFILALCPFILGAQIIYVINSQSRTLSRIDLQANEVENSFAFLGNVPNKLVMDEDYLYVINSGDNSVQKISKSSGLTLDNHFVAIGSNPWDAVIHDGYMYISGLFSSRIYKMDPVSGEVLASVVVGAAPEAMAIWESKLYVCNAGNYAENYAGSSVSVIDLESFSLLKNIPTTLNPQFIRVYEGMIHVSCTGNWADIAGAICIIDPQTDELVHTVAIGGTPGNLWMDEPGTAYVADNSGYSMYSYNALDYSPLHPAANPLPFAASDLIGNKDFIALLNPNWGSNATVQILDHELELLSSFTVGMMPTDIKLQEVSSSLADHTVPQLDSHIRVYPSPLRAGDTLNLKSLDATGGEFCLYNIRGQLLQKIPLAKHEQKAVSLNLPNGAYIYRYKGYGAESRGKLVIIR